MKSKYETGLRFLSNSPELKTNAVETTISAEAIIALYFDVSIEGNLEKLLKAERTEVIKDFLNHAKIDKLDDFKNKLNAQYGEKQNKEIKDIFLVLRRLLQGELKPNARLMGDLFKSTEHEGSKVNEELIKKYNALISKCVCEKMEEFFQERSFSPFPRP